MDDQEGERRQRLAALVRKRRLSLQLTKDAAAVAGKMSAMTWTKVEAGKPVRPHILYGVDRALRWQPGAAELVLDGVSVDPSPAVVVTEMPSPEPGVTVHIAELADELEKVSPEDREEAVRIALDLFRAITGRSGR